MTVETEKSDKVQEWLQTNSCHISKIHTLARRTGNEERTHGN